MPHRCYRRAGGKSSVHASSHPYFVPPRFQLTAREIDSAPVGTAVWDEKVRGLHVRVFNGRRAFYLKYRTQDGRQRRPKLGDYGVLTIPLAREIAIARLRIVLAGGDPDADAKKHTVADLQKRFMDVHGSKRKPKTQAMYRSAFAHAAKLLKAPVAAVTRADISDLHHIMRNTPIQANRVLSVLHKAFNLAEVWGWRPQHSNPVHGIDRNREKKRQRYPTPAEAARLFRALDRFDNPIFTGYVWLLALTGARPGEIRTARREWVHADGIHLPDSKGGEAIIAMPKAAKDVAWSLPVIAGNQYLIPGRKNGQPLVGTKKLWRELCAEAKIEGLQMRDLRRYFASLGLSADLNLEQIGQLLRHRQAQTTKVYAYLMEGTRQKAVEAVAAELKKVSRRRGRRP